MQQQHWNNTTRTIKNPPNIYQDLRIPVVKTEIGQQKAKYLKGLVTNPNQLAKSLIEVNNNTHLQHNDSPAQMPKLTAIQNNCLIKWVD